MDYDELATHFEFDSWRGLRRRQHELFIQNFFIADDVFDDWTRVRSQALPTESGAPGELTMWELGENGSRLLSIVTYEANSLEGAHSMMLSMLGEFQSPRIVRHDEHVFGDASFGDESGLWILFSAANVVALVRNAGPEATRVDEVVSSLVNWIEDEPIPGGKVVPEIEDVTIEQTEAQDRWRLRVTVSDPLGHDVMIKIFSRQGQVMRENDILTFKGRQSGAVSVTVFAINERRGVATSSASAG